MPELIDLIADLSAATRPSRILDCRIHQFFHPEHEILTDPGDAREGRPAAFGRLEDLDMLGWREAFGDTLARYIGAPAYTESLDAITAAIRQRWPDAFVSSQSGGELGPGADATIKVNGVCRYIEDAATEPLGRCMAAVRMAAVEAGAPHA